MLPTRKSVPRSSRQFDHTKIWRSQRDANCSGMVMFPVHQVWPKPSCKAQWKWEEDQANRGRGGKTTSGRQAGVRQISEGSGEGKKWRKLAATSSVVPQRPSRLRDRWWWCWWCKLKDESSVLVTDNLTDITRSAGCGMSVKFKRVTNKHNSLSKVQDEF